MSEIYYLTIFAILSDIQFGNTRYQEIDKKFLREFEKFDQALESLRNIKNLNLMKNFPFAAIEYIVAEKKEYIINKQKYISSMKIIIAIMSLSIQIIFHLLH